MKNNTTCVLALLAIVFCLNLPQTAVCQKKKDYMACDAWVNATMEKMTLEEKIAQLMVVRVPTKMTPKAKKAFLENITRYKVGGLCFFAGKCADQLEQTKEYQKLAETPLLICIDGEWGLGMRLTDAYSFPRQMMAGALSNDTLIYEMASEIALQCRKMGIHVNFAPCVDVNSNPMNPVIGCRSFGENPTSVARKSLQYVKGLQDHGVMAVAKHFPGHGNTDVDSHLDLPVITQSKQELSKTELVPYRLLVHHKVQGIMVAHLQVNAYDNRKNRPSSLSKNIVTDLLRKELKYNGLVFTDGMDMNAISKNFKNGSAELEAILAGTDVLLLPENVEKSLNAIKTAADSDTILQELIEIKCRKVLKNKYQLGACTQDLKSLSVPDTNDWNRCVAIAQKIADESLTLIKNQNSLLPLRNLKNKNLVSIHLGESGKSSNVFTETIDRYATCRHIFLPDQVADTFHFADSLKNCDVAIVSIYGFANPTSKKNYGLANAYLSVVDTIVSLSKSVIVNFFGSPYAAKYFEKISANAITIGYQNMDCTQRSAAEAVVGAIGVKGKLPVSTGSLKEGIGLRTKKIRKKYDENRYSARKFAKIDSIANYGIKQHAYPGCQILVAKDGEVIYNRNFGHLTYDKKSPAVNDSTMYDLASLTKVSATTFAVMKLADAGKIKLTDPLSKYLPYLKKTNKSKITMLEALSHYARLQAFIPFWKETVKKGKLNSKIYAENPADKSEYCHLAGNLYIKRDYRDEVLKSIAKSDLIKKRKYLYSDFGFILLADMVEKVSGQSLDIFMNDHFYQPLQMTRTSFKPLQNGFPKSNIAPTENDTHFRNVQLQGTVHDENAALMGGVAGHAGLFSTASDLARLFQLLLNGGSANGRKYLSPEIINTFNQRHFADAGNRRALGFDKPLIGGKSSHCAPEASQQSFGHSGFTGTFVWIDPEYNLVYIFLSNRVYPETSPNRLANLSIRTNIQSEIYKIIKE